MFSYSEANLVRGKETLSSSNLVKGARRPICSALALLCPARKVIIGAPVHRIIRR